MTLTLQLTPAQEARLREDAARAGVDPAALLLSRAGYTSAAQAVPGGAEWQAEAQRFRQWADAHAQKGAGLPPEALSRDSIYGEHG